MNIISNVFGSSLGRKYVMAITGLVLFGFVVGHLVGNLQIFLGPEPINRYGAFLQGFGELLWPVRIFLLSMVVLHFWAAAKLTAENRAARPVQYAAYQPVAASLASRTMLMSGGIILAFVIYHLLHFTAQVNYINLTGQDFGAFLDAQHRHDIYKMMVVGFSDWRVSLFYLIGIALLCLHLSHGASSMFQSLGLKNEAYRRILDRLARIVAAAIFVGYASIPVAILFGLGKAVLK
jgi:succinate dehydrogenase / fumarate reductase cytochrome b subunit